MNELVLVVDDDADSAEAVAVYLGRSGYRTARARDGREALAAVIANPPAAIVLDLGMPGMDGMTFLDVMQSYSRIRSIPVVVLTGTEDELVQERLSSLEVRAVLVKGRTRMADIAEAVDSAISQPRRFILDLPTEGASSGAMEPG